ncbi:DUF7282 domain-containing protein [Halococcus sp. AFM35]|uniref:DUF7282 domain-containing protein n=1 Tax=Halococcus sp. AFM35 TaxID=3421653 RepID=UPI003EB93B52
MVHFDSNENGQFDFVRTNGSVDGPYVEGTQAVVESAEISVEHEERTTSDGGFDIGLVPLVAAGFVLLALVVLAAVVARRR